MIRFWHLLVVLWRIIRRDVHALEYDAHVQFRSNVTMATVWFVSMVGLTGYWFLGGMFGANLSAWLLFFTLWVSLYANFATHFDAMSASLAAMTAADIQHSK